LKKKVEAFMGVSKATERSVEETMSTPLPGETLKLFYDRTREVSMKVFFFAPLGSFN
jgi:hypothetical protein